MTEGQGVPNHQMLPIGGVLHVLALRFVSFIGASTHMWDDTAGGGYSQIKVSQAAPRVAIMDSHTVCLAPRVGVVDSRTLWCRPSSGVDESSGRLNLFITATHQEVLDCK